MDVSSSGLTIPTASYLLLNFPALWSNSAGGSTFSSATSACTSSSSPSITCSVVGQRIVKAENILASPSSTQFSFTLTDVTNPGSVQTNKQMYFEVYGDSKQMGVCGVQIAGLTKKTLGDLQFTTSTSVLSAVGSGQVYFTLPSATQVTDSVRISIPKDYGISSLKLATKRINTESTTVQLETYINDPTASHYEIELFPFTIETIASYTLTLYDLTMPSAEITAGSISVGIYRKGYLVADGTCCSLAFNSISSGSLSISLLDNSVGVQTSYEVVVSGVSVLGFTQMVLEFDAAYSLTKTTYSCSIIGLESILQPICTKTASNTITITNVLQFANFESVSFTVRLEGVENPVTLAQLTASLTTQDSSSNAVQTLTGQYSLSATLIQSVSIVVSPSVTYGTAEYQFIIDNTNSLPIGTDIKITFAAEAKLTAQSKCLINSAQQGSAVFDVGAGTVSFALGNGAAVSSGGLSAYNITISGVLNPASLAMTDSFSLEISENGNILEQRSYGVIVAIAT